LSIAILADKILAIYAIPTNWQNIQFQFAKIAKKYNYKLRINEKDYLILFKKIKNIVLQIHPEK